MAEIPQENTENAGALTGATAEEIGLSDLAPHDHVVREMLTASPLEVRLRYEEDVAAAYRSWYKEQLVKEQRPELGRFLFGVSFATIGILATISKLTPATEASTRDIIWLGWAVGVLLLSSGCSLYLAVPKNQLLDPNTMELVKTHKATTDELRGVALAWLCLWVLGLLIGVVGLVF